MSVAMAAGAHGAATHPEGRLLGLVSVNLRQLAADAAALAAKAATAAAKSPAQSPLSDSSGGVGIRRSSSVRMGMGQSFSATAKTFLRTFALVDGDGREVMSHVHPSSVSTSQIPIHFFI